MDSSKGATRLRSRDMIGRSIGGFRVEHLLGKGSSGVVFRAVQESVQRPVALKILTSKWASDPTNLARFRREALAAARIQHPHVVSVIDYGESSGLFYMAMTFVDGQSLGDILRQRPKLDSAITARIGYQIASALEAIGQAGLIHRDIKPANIMVARQDGQGFLTDLGLAKATDNSQDITLKGFTVGTPNYIAPEQALAEDDLTIACDIYSLGATLYHACSGQLVFNRANAFQVMKAHVKEPPTDPRELDPTIPAKLAGLLLAMLEKSPLHRPSPSECAAILQEVIVETTGQHPVTASSPNVSESASSRVARYAQMASPPAVSQSGAQSGSRRRSAGTIEAPEPSPPPKKRRRKTSSPQPAPSSPLVPILATIAVLLAIITVLLLVSS